MVTGAGALSLPDARIDAGHARGFAAFRVFDIQEARGLGVLRWIRRRSSVTMMSTWPAPSGCAGVPAGSVCRAGGSVRVSAALPLRAPRSRAPATPRPRPPATSGCPAARSRSRDLHGLTPGRRVDRGGHGAHRRAARPSRRSCTGSRRGRAFRRGRSGAGSRAPLRGRSPVRAGKTPPASRP